MKILTEAEVGDVVIPVNIRYSKRTPHSLYLTFVTTHPVTWELEREMLRDGLGHKVGEGDVQIAPGTASIHLHLNTPSGEAYVVLPRGAVEAALRKSARMVPYGNEHLFMDWSSLPRPEVAS